MQRPGELSIDGVGARGVRYEGAAAGAAEAGAVGTHTSRWGPDLGCIDAERGEKRRVVQHFSEIRFYNIYARVHRSKIQDFNKC